MHFHNHRYKLIRQTGRGIGGIFVKVLSALRRLIVPNVKKLASSAIGKAVGKAAALPLKSLLLLQAKLLPEGLLLLLPDWPLAGNCYDGALCSRALSAAPLEAALKAARQQGSTGRCPPQAPPCLRRGEGLTAHFKLQAVFPKLCTAIFLR